jgi:CheY-like chemotaxis protein
MLRRLIGEHIDLRFDPHADLPSVEADAGMLEQVVMNLVVNARDAMPGGGRITIATGVEVLGADDVQVHPGRRAGTFARLSVTDTGTGMDAATVARLFEPFFTTKEAGKGTGLGLATVHGIVAQHNGWVEVTSEPGRGATFDVFIPAIEAVVPAETQEAQADVPVPGGSETILVVEDEANLRALIALTLEGLGYRTLQASSGREALRVWRRHGRDVDLLLTDVVMPEGMTGIQLSERLTARKPSLRTIISSGYSAELAQFGASAKDGTTYLAKPYDRPELARAVREALDRS